MDIMIRFVDKTIGFVIRAMLQMPFEKRCRFGGEEHGTLEHQASGHNVPPVT